MQSGLIALIALNFHSPLLISGSECVWSWGRILVIHTYLNMNEIGMGHWIWKIPSTWWHHCIWRILCVGFPCSSEYKESSFNAGDLGLSPGQEDSLKKGMATHSSILGWRISWAEEPGGLQFMGFRRVRHDWMTNTSNTVYKLAKGLSLRSYYQILSASERWQGVWSHTWSSNDRVLNQLICF